MTPMLDVLATAGVSIGLAGFFLWLLITAVRQEREADPDRSRRAPTTKTRAAGALGKGGFAHG
jgi:hypothetical protein